jgi:hypothetical protein
MSAPLPVRAPDIQITRTGLLAAVNGAQPLTAQPDAATLYHHRSMAERRR